MSVLSHFEDFSDNLRTGESLLSKRLPPQVMCRTAVRWLSHGYYSRKRALRSQRNLCFLGHLLRLSENLRTMRVCDGKRLTPRLAWRSAIRRLTFRAVRTCL